MQRDKYIGRVLRLKKNGWFIVPFDRLMNANNEILYYQCVVLKGGSTPYEQQQGDRYLLDAKDLGEVEIKM